MLVTLRINKLKVVIIRSDQISFSPLGMRPVSGKTLTGKTTVGANGISSVVGKIEGGGSS